MSLKHCPNMKKPCINHPKYMYSGKESSPLGLGIAAEPIVLGTIQEGRDSTNWIVTMKNGIKVWSRITRLSELDNKTDDIPSNPSTTKKDAPSKKKLSSISKKRGDKDDSIITGSDIILDNVSVNLDNKEKVTTTTTTTNPKRRATDYNIYMKYKLKQLAKENNTMKPTERMAHAVALWNSMDSNTKKEELIKAKEAIAIQNE